MSESDVPAVEGLPVVGNALGMARDPWGVTERAASEGDVVRMRILRREPYLVTHPAAFERVLLSESDRFRKADVLSEALADVAETAVISAEGEQWRRIRSSLEPAFDARRVSSFADEIVAETRRHVDRWEDGQRIDVGAEMRTLTASIFGATLFGDGYEPLSAATNELVAAMADRFEMPALFVPDWVPTRTNRRFDAAVDRFDGTLERAIADRREGDGETESAGFDVLGALVDAADEGELSDQELKDQLFTLLFAGHGPTATALEFAWFSLARTPEVAERLASEVDDLEGEPSLSSPGPDSYVASVVDETLRLYPPVFELWREPNADVTIRGYEVPAGTELLLPVYTLHRDERWWDEPEQFRPERWADEDVPAEEFAYVPFGVGPRSCIGRRLATLTLRLAVATIARRYRFELAPDQSRTVDLGLSTTLSPSEPIELVVRERSD
ncbi:cytochrome P450 [Natrialbaceae archaeon AArc-T1-2]|uniref:cytochrome P450 n=1 Tax=Natrialbaceae archaeon AArc-T1-2 TaxID=3053904 RepID=UPI00255AB652|nr:cytochrome P450 [Natrialbaceae archaeon AArc-T1-2]WIV66243.1 cytochrome P450 [Natrialbaceae archaeon AArc-T1-2]